MAHADIPEYWMA